MLASNKQKTAYDAQVGGEFRSVLFRSPFATALQATVKDAGGNPVSGVTVTFTAPSSGASAGFGSSATATAVTNNSGQATASTLTANSTVSSYTVTPTVTGMTTTASFSLPNAAEPPPRLPATPGPPHS